MSPVQCLKGLSLAAVLCISGCATINQIGFPTSTSNKGKLVTASLTHFSPFFLLPPSGLEKLVSDLSEQCDNGGVVGITMVDTRRYFYVFGVLQTVEASGRCQEAG